MANQQKPPTASLQHPRLSLAEEQRQAFEADRLRRRSRPEGGLGLLGLIFRN
jgi:hypothetical protein